MYEQFCEHLLTCKMTYMWLDLPCTVWVHVHCMYVPGELTSHEVYDYICGTCMPANPSLTQVSLQFLFDDESGLKEHPSTHSCICGLFIHKHRILHSSQSEWCTHHSLSLTSENILQLFSLNCALLSEVHVPKSITCTGRERKLTPYTSPEFLWESPGHTWQTKSMNHIISHQLIAWHLQKKKSDSVIPRLHIYSCHTHRS